MNNIPSIFLRILIVFSFTCAVSSQLPGQVTLASKSEVQNYFSGTWTLSSHHYSIAGIVDEYPRDFESYQLIFSQGIDDATLNVEVYRNQCLKSSSQIIITEDSQLGCSWKLEHFPTILPLEWLTETRFICHEIGVDSINLWDGIFDGSFFNLERADDFEPQNCFVPDDFEFLNHQFGVNFTLRFKILNEGIVFVSQRLSETDIMAVGYNNNIDTLDRPEYAIYSNYIGRSKMNKLENGNYEFVLYTLLDYDYFVPGFIRYTMNDFTILSREHVFSDRSNNMTIYDIERTSSGEYWALYGNDNLIKIVDDEIVETHEVTSVGSIFVDKQEKIYGFSPSTRRTSDLYVFDGEEFNSIISDLFIHGVEEFGDHKYLLLDGELRQYNNDFSEIISSWDIPTAVTNFNQFEFFSSYLIAGFTENGTNKIIRLTLGGDIQSVWTAGQSTSPGTIRQIAIQSDSTILLSGTYNPIDIYNAQSFFRSVPVSYTPNYQRHEVSLNSVTVTEKNVERELVIVHSNGDSVWRTNADYEFDIELENKGPNSAKITNIYGPKTDHHELDETQNYLYDKFIDPNEKIDFNFTQNYEKISFEGFEYGIPGVDYRFNRGNIISIGDFTSSLSDDISNAKQPLYPNPATNTLHLPENINAKSVAIHNNLGQLVYFKNNFLTNTIDISQLQSGMYTLVANPINSDQSQVFKFIKE